MSTLVVQGNASGTGTITVQGPNTNSNYTISIPAETGTLLTDAAAATQANQETATSTTTYVSPGRQQYHPSAAKAWCYWSPAAAIAASYNVSSITDTGIGNWTINFTSSFSSGSYAAVPGLSLSSFNGTQPGLGSLASGSVQVVSTDKDGAVTEAAVLGASVVCFGDQ